MLKRRFRFFKIIDGEKQYLNYYNDYYTDRQRAGLFSEIDWTDWAEDRCLEREEIGEDEAMRLVGAPLLSGLE